MSFDLRRLGLTGLALLVTLSAFGQNWRSIARLTELTTVSNIFFLNEREGWRAGAYSGVGSMLWHTSDGGATWQDLWKPGTTPGGFGGWTRGLWFADSYTGFRYTSDGYLFRTTDGGRTWASLPVTLSSGRILNFFVKNRNELFVLGTDSQLKRSVDGGLSWTTILMPATTDLKEMDFTSDAEGWMVGDRKLFKTTDGGASWVPQGLASGGNAFYDVDFCDAQNGFIAHGDGVMRTTDGGQTWANWSFYIHPVRYVQTFSPQRVSFMDIYTHVSSTSDGGQTWSNNLGSSFNSSGYYPMFQIVSAGKMYVATEQGGFYVSTNAGAGFTRDVTQGPDPRYDATDVIYGAGNRAMVSYYLAGSSSNIATTTTNGNTFSYTRGESDNVVDAPFFYRQSANNLYLTGYQVFRSTNNGGSWAAWAALKANDMQFMDAQNLWISWNANVLRSYDGGGSYQTRPIGVTGTARGLHFTGDLNGVVWVDEKLMRTQDGGVSWTQIYTAPASVKSVRWVSTTEGYAFYNGRGYLKTTDAGLSWTALPSPDGTALHGILVRSAAERYLYGEHIHFSGDGGQNWRIHWVDGAHGMIMGMAFNSAGTQGLAVCERGAVLRWLSDAVLVGTALALQAAPVLVCYPNPAAAGRVRVSVGPSGPGELRVLDTQGRTLRRIANPDGAAEVSVDATGLPTGIYVLRYQGRQSAVGRLVVE